MNMNLNMNEFKEYLLYTHMSGNVSLTTYLIGPWFAQVVIGGTLLFLEFATVPYAHNTFIQNASNYVVE